MNAGQTLGILAEVVDERVRQDAKWGEQNHPNGTGPGVVWTLPGRHPAALMATRARDMCQEADRRGECTWLLIALEEMAAAFAESNPYELRREVLQLVAVGVTWIEAIDRAAARKAAGCGS